MLAVLCKLDTQEAEVTKDTGQDKDQAGKHVGDPKVPLVVLLVDIAAHDWNAHLREVVTDAKDASQGSEVGVDQEESTGVGVKVLVGVI